jgi:hypothetical protein
MVTLCSIKVITHFLIIFTAIEFLVLTYYEPTGTFLSVVLTSVYSKIYLLFYGRHASTFIVFLGTFIIRLRHYLR